ncbi:MAG: hypothetical protein ABEH38_08045 [Flavobacteriales bacterium]
MRNVLISIASAAFLLLSLGGAAQPDLSQKEVKELRSLKEELKGTYQIQMIGTRKKPSVMLSLYDSIANKRKEEEVVYHRVNEKMRIKILPREKIEASNFKGVEPRVVHLEESEVD